MHIIGLATAFWKPVRCIHSREILGQSLASDDPAGRLPPPHPSISPRSRIAIPHGTKNYTRQSLHTAPSSCVHSEYSIARALGISSRSTSASSSRPSSTHLRHCLQASFPASVSGGAYLRSIFRRRWGSPSRASLLRRTGESLGSYGVGASWLGMCGCWRG